MADDYKPLEKVELIPKKGQNFREAANELIYRFWDLKGIEPALCRFEISFDGEHFETIQTVAFPTTETGNDVDFYDDWYMGVHRAFLCGIAAVYELEIGGRGLFRDMAGSWEEET